MKKQKTIWVEVVKIPGGGRVIKEGTIGRYHTEADGAFEVLASAYYLRKILHGELRQVSAPRAKKDEKP